MLEIFFSLERCTRMSAGDGEVVVESKVSNKLNKSSFLINFFPPFQQPRTAMKDRKVFTQ